MENSRADMYQFLSRIYILEVDKEMLDAMTKMQFPEKTANTELSDGYKMLEDYLKTVNDDTLDTLAVDYARIFLAAGVAQGNAAFPYESVYTSREQLVMQDSNASVSRKYAEKELAPKKDMYRIPNDHIGLELDYMSKLCRQDDNSQSFEEQKEFFKEHLYKWVPVFLSEMERYVTTEFYKGIAKITRGFLEMEGEVYYEL